LHRDESLRLHQALVAKTPKHEYHKRIEELTAAATTEASDAPE
jgi:hypothetical protein